MSSLSAFTNQLQNLISNLCEMYPDDPDLEFTKNSINLLKKTNPRKLHELFNSYVTQHNNEIMNKNEDFFISRDFVRTDLELDTQEDNDYAYLIMKNLKKYWNSMDQESKDNIWKYLQVLVVLNNKCLKK